MTEVGQTATLAVTGDPEAADQSGPHGRLAIYDDRRGRRPGGPGPSDGSAVSGSSSVSGSRLSVSGSSSVSGSRTHMSTPLPRVLVADDEPAIRTALTRALELEGFVVATVDGGAAALAAVASDAPDVAVLDVVMPDVDGVTVTRTLRDQGRDLPILILSALDEVDDRVAGLQAGADDYLVKPFAVDELVARLRALLRRRPEPVSVPLRVGDVLIDPARHLARRGDRDLELTRREFELLEAFVRHRGIVLTRQQLLRQVWGYDFEVDGNVVDVFVGYVRRKLEANGEPRVLRTVRGVGFKLEP